MEMQYKFCTLMLLTSHLIIKVKSECPKPELLSECKCVDDVISCGGSAYINIKHIFNLLHYQLDDNKKHFKHFFMNNTAISEIKENTFHSITFDRIDFSMATNLSLIHTNAFGLTNFVTKQFDSWQTSLKNIPPNYDLFTMLSKFSNLEVLYMCDTDIIEIPSYAFKPINGYQSKLKSITTNSNHQLTVKNFAFYYLNSLSIINLYYKDTFNKLPEHVFKFERPSNNLIEILVKPYMFNSSFSSTRFMLDIERPAILKVNSDYSPNLSIDYLDEYIYTQFLQSNSLNRIDIDDNTKFLLIDCNDCRNYWLRKNNKYLERISNVKCYDKTEITFKNNFLNCEN